MCDKVIQKPFVSFVIPVYNVAPYISKCLDSIINQSFALWEAVVVDDGSSDKSALICDEYAKRDGRIHVYHKTNGGVSSARNYALDKIVGEWVWFVDSDDYIKEDSLKILSDAIASCECDLIFHGLIEVFDNKKIENTHREDFISSKSNFLDNNHCFQNGMLLFRHHIIENFHLRFSNDVKYAEDMEFQYKYLLHSKRPIRISDSLYFYRHREGSAMNNSNYHKKNMEDCLYVSKKLLTYSCSLNHTEDIWFAYRLRLLLKSCIQSAEALPFDDVKYLQSELCDFFVKAKQCGYSHIFDKILYLAEYNIKLYFIMLRLYKKLWR